MSFGSVSACKFRPGDRVRCVENTPAEEHHGLVRDLVYTVDHTLGNTLSLEGLDSAAWFYDWRFELVERPESSKTTYEVITELTLEAKRVAPIVRAAEALAALADHDFSADPGPVFEAVFAVHDAVLAAKGK